MKVNLYENYVTTLKNSEREREIEKERKRESNFSICHNSLKLACKYSSFSPLKIVRILSQGLTLYLYSPNHNIMLLWPSEMYRFHVKMFFDSCVKFQLVDLSPSCISRCSIKAMYFLFSRMLNNFLNAKNDDCVSAAYPTVLGTEIGCFAICPCTISINDLLSMNG